MPLSICVGLGILLWFYLLAKAQKNRQRGFICHVPFAIRGCGGDSEPQPTPPTYQLPSWAEGLPPEILTYIRQGVGQKLIEPSEYGVASQTLQDLLGYTPKQFQYPMEDIQKALAAQQAIQLQEYQNQIRPILANQGQLDSTYYADLLGKYLQGQQAQTYGTTADLLTNQATQNYELSKWLPTFRGNLAEALKGVGGARSDINLTNMQYPYQTYIPAFERMFAAGSQEGTKAYNSALNQYQVAMQNWQKEQEEKAGMLGSIGQMGGAAIALGLAPFTGGASLAFLPMATQLGGTASSLWGGSSPSGGSNIDLSGLFSSQYNPSWPGQAQTGLSGYENIMTAPANYYKQPPLRGTPYWKVMR